MEQNKSGQPGKTQTYDDAALLSQFFEIGLNFLCIIAADGKIIKANKPWEELLGYPQKDLIGHSFSQFVFREDAEAAEKALFELANTNKTVGFISRLNGKNGKWLCLEWEAQFLDGLIYASGKDITGKKIVEDLLQTRDTKIFSDYIKKELNTSGHSSKTLAEILIPSETVLLLGSWEGVGCAYGIVKDISAEHAVLENFYKIIDAIPAIMVLTNAENYRIIDVNAAFTEKLGYSRDEAIGRTAVELKICNEAVYKKDIAKVMLEQGGFRDKYIKIRNRWGQVIDGLHSGVILDNKREKYFFTVTLDMTALKETEHRKTSRIRLLESLLDSIPEAVFYKDGEGTYLDCNTACAKLLGRDKNMIVGKTDMDVVNPEAAERARFIDRETLRSRRTIRTEDWFVLGDGVRTLCEILKAPHVDAEGNVIGIVGICRDITEQRRREEESRYLSYHDPLTGLYNRRYYEEELRRIDVDRNLPVSIILGDVNSLKFVNDIFGHQEGDRLIKCAAQAIRSSCRAGDIVARIGGDEFALLLPNTDFADSQRVLGRINEQIAIGKAGMLDATVSFGGATKVSGTQDIYDIIKKAEDRMYRNKFERRSADGKTIGALIGTLYEKSRREMEHSKRVGELCAAIAAAMGLDSYTVNRIKLAGIMHDIGKIYIDENILLKKGRLTLTEQGEIHCHPELGYRILSASESFSDIAQYVFQHHEHWDGGGYPKKLKAEEILLPARIIAVAEAYDAMINPISSNAMTPDEGARELLRCAGIRYDPDVVKVFVEKCLK